MVNNKINEPVTQICLIFLQHLLVIGVFLIGYFLNQTIEIQQFFQQNDLRATCWDATHKTNRRTP